MTLDGEVVDRSARGSAPLVLRIIAVLFVLQGVSAAIQIVQSLASRSIYPSFGLLALFIGIGLWRVHPAARRWAIVYNSVALAFILFVGFMIFGRSAT